MRFAKNFFAGGYRNVKLGSTRILEGSEGGGAEFVIECR